MVQIAADALGCEMKSGGAAPGYTLNHPRWYRTPVSTYWWLGQWTYLKFVLRELTSIFVAFFVVTTLVRLRALHNGPQAYADFQKWLKNPAVIALNAISFCFVVYHTVTWFALAPRAMAVRVRGKRVPEPLIMAANYAAWLAVSGMVAWFLLGG
jgi:fumarate reductase subunit C